MDSSLLGKLDQAIANLPEGLLKKGTLENKEIFEKYFPVFESDIWKKQTESEDKTVTAYYAKNEEKQLMAKGVAHMPFKPDKVRKYESKMENKPLYDENFVEGKIITEIEDKDNEVIFYEVMMRKGNIKMVDDRDFIVNHTSFKVGDTWYAVSHSVELPDWPEVKDCIRGSLDFFIWIYEIGEGGKGCKTSRMFRVDPKGSLP